MSVNIFQVITHEFNDESMTWLPWPVSNELSTQPMLNHRLSVLSSLDRLVMAIRLLSVDSSLNHHSWVITYRSYAVHRMLKSKNRHVTWLHKQGKNVWLSTETCMASQPGPLCQGKCSHVIHDVYSTSLLVLINKFVMSGKSKTITLNWYNYVSPTDRLRCFHHCSVIVVHCIGIL